MSRTVLSPALRVAIEADLADGATQAVVAQRWGVSVRTLKYWLQQGKVVRPTSVQVETPEPVVPDPRPPAGESLAQRIESAEPGLVAAIIAAAQRGSWQAAAWLLERSFPDRWGRREPGAVAAPKDRFSEIDEMAQRRRAA